MLYYSNVRSNIECSNGNLVLMSNKKLYMHAWVCRVCKVYKWPGTGF